MPRKVLREKRDLIYWRQSECGSSTPVDGGIDITVRPTTSADDAATFVSLCGGRAASSSLFALITDAAPRVRARRD
jgi:hypothetical protein